ncbi:MAG: hypothetical protein V2A34_06875, partial [Lentisphaerota bacterium]
PDGWEYRYWLNATSAPPTVDDDGDTVNNLAEFTTNANPRNDLSGTTLFNGLPAGWRQKYFPTNSAIITPAEDPDSDGQNNYQESIAGTNPTNHLSFFRVTTERVPGSMTLRFIWASAPDRTYEMQRGTRLQEPNDFAVTGPGISAQPYPSTNRVDINMDSSSSNLYYRLGAFYP